MTARTSTQAHAYTRPRCQISRAEKKEKRLGFDGLVNTISDLKRASLYNIRIYLKHCHKLAQTVTKQENFISFSCKDLDRFLEKIVKNNENKC